MTKRKHPKEKSSLHPRNRHRQRYNFQELIKSHPPLKPYVRLNDYQDESIDFFNPVAVKMLNTALLKHHYQLEYWDIPPQYLCPPIPGRADYIHHIADLLSLQNKGKIPKGSSITCLDIGTGANCIYPIIGHREYGWHFIGSEIDPDAIFSAEKIIWYNNTLKDKINIRWQRDKTDIFYGIIKENDFIDCTICNPPFHASLKEAQTVARRKLRNLQRKNRKIVLNFGGKSNELWYEGGEKKFIQKMISESQKFAKKCCWFTTLVSKKDHLPPLDKLLKKVKANEVKTIQMGQGNKVSRLIAWTFWTLEERQKWSKERWKE